MTLLLGDTVPDFRANTTTGPISFHDWIGDDWAFFFSHPADFTPVYTTEMGRTSQLSEEFTKRGVKPIGLSTDTVEEHLNWIEDVNDTQNTTLRFPIVADPDFEIMAPPVLSLINFRYHPRGVDDAATGTNG